MSEDILTLFFEADILGEVEDKFLGEWEGWYGPISLKVLGGKLKGIYKAIRGETNKEDMEWDMLMELERDVLPILKEAYDITAANVHKERDE